MPLKESDLRKVTFPVPSENLTNLINSYFAKRYLEKSYDKVLAKLELVLEEERFDGEWLELMYQQWEQEQPPR